MNFNDDLLDRESYSKFLTQILENPIEYKRLSDSKSLSIAIDSSWGTGKTTFIEMWKEKLKEKFVVVTYNAWKNDFAENAFESLGYEILTNEIFKKENDKKEVKSVLKNMTNVGREILKAILKMKVSQKFDESTGEMFEKILDGEENIWDFMRNIDSEDKLGNFYSNYVMYSNTIQELKKALSEAAENKNIIIIIDELDRCKPLFAIKLLEDVKHIFDVQNVSFVFALDMEQLSSSIKCVYGENMDASGYLCRFFDYVSKMPKANTKKFIEKLVDSKPLFSNQNFKNIELYYHQDNRGVKFSELLESFSYDMNLSLRDINTIYYNFKIFADIYLVGIECLEAYSFYLMMLILKYKYIDLFNKIFIKNNWNTDDLKIIPIKIKYFDTNIFNELGFRKRIKDFLVNGKLKSINGYEFRENELETIQNIPGNRKLSFYNCLFYNDIKEWNTISNKMFIKYIQEKLEFFNFHP